MAKKEYTNEQLFALGKSSYEKLVLHCQTLETSGFWEKAREVMKQSSTEVLDLYVQAVLMKLAVHCKNVQRSQLQFMQTVPISNPFGLSEDTKLDSELISDADRLYHMPPVLIQLCSLYDKERGDDMTAYFVDALLNMLLCMAYLNRAKNAEINEFIQKYYNKISFFVEDKSAQEHSKYLFKKLSNDTIECDVKKRVPVQKQAEAVSLPETEKAETDRREVKEQEKVSEDDGKVPETQEKKKKKKNRKNTKKEHPVADRAAQYTETAREEKEAEISAQAKERFLQVKQRIQERERAEEEEREFRLQALIAELNALVGLDNVKREIQSLVNLIKIRKLRAQMNLPEMEMSYHMVFTGSPGTGKTTVARLVAKIYKELGILSEGNLVETDRSGLVAGYVGQTAIKVHEIVEQAIGGILFIDEAYSLANPDVQNDFGTEAVDTLVKLMEDHRDNLVIIVAGYTEEMQVFLKSNTGLISRFNKFIDFADYSKTDLVQIMEVMAEKAGLIIEEPAQRAVLAMLNEKKDEEWENFGNARGVRNLFEKFIMNQANRLVTMDSPTKEDLITIKREDVAV